ncbi:MAG: hypothetical protein Kow00107_11390 [Planctomycetota bacterium]
MKRFGPLLLLLALNHMMLIAPMGVICVVQDSVPASRESRSQSAGNFSGSGGNLQAEPQQTPQLTRTTAGGSNDIAAVPTAISTLLECEKGLARFEGLSGTQRTISSNPRSPRAPPAVI